MGARHGMSKDDQLEHSRPIRSASQTDTEVECAGAPVFFRSRTTVQAAWVELSSSSCGLQSERGTPENTRVLPATLSLRTLCLIRSRK